MRVLKNIRLLSCLMVLAAASLWLMAFSTESTDITIYLIGDSTMSEKEVRAYPETGWGTPFPHYFKEGVIVENHAVNGRSTRTFIEEGRWGPIVAKLKEGDYVFIQFGHNDEDPGKTRYTPPDQFQQFLRQYISETRGKGAQPVLLTPITRRQFDENGAVKETHEEYSELMREVAESENVPLIDMDRKSQALLNELGVDKSTLLFLHLKSGQNPNYPDGITDNTHFSETGARMMAELVIQGMQELELGVVNQLVNSQ